MSDLLECLLQIKGLHETCARLHALSAEVDVPRWLHPPRGGGRSALDLLALMSEAERLHGNWLRLMLASPEPSLSAEDARVLPERARRDVPLDVGATLAQFLARRRENLELLDRCSAGDLSRTGAHPARRHMIVADLVALMMASDAEKVSEIRRALRE